MSVGGEGMALGPGEGKTVSIMGNQVAATLKALGPDTEGAYSCFEFTMSPGVASPPLHVHRGHAEACYVLEGEVHFQVDDEIVFGTPGSFVLAPKGVPHTFWNPAARAARMLWIYSPPGYERTFEEMAERVSAGATAEDVNRIREEIMVRYDTEFVVSS
jgi:quercetin dioxygenase-like cupin family protein